MVCSVQCDVPDTSRVCSHSQTLEKGSRKVDTVIAKAGPFFLAEDYHQHYIAKQRGKY